MSNKKNQKKDVEQVSTQQVPTQIINEEKTQKMEEQTTPDVPTQDVPPTQDATQDQQKVEDQPKVEEKPTLEQLQEIADKAAEVAFSARKDANISEEEKAKLRLISYKADKDLDAAKNEIKVKETLKVVDAKRVAFIDDTLNSLLSLRGEILAKPDDKELLKLYEDKYEYVKGLLEPAFKSSLMSEEKHIKMGATGKSLEKKEKSSDSTPSNGTSKSAQIKELLETGKNADEIVEITGFPKKLITDYRWNWEKATGRR